MDIKRLISKLPVPEWIATNAPTPASLMGATATRQDSHDESLGLEPAASSPAPTNTTASSSAPIHRIFTTRQTSTPSTLALDDDTSVSTILTSTTASSCVPQHTSFLPGDLEGFADSVQPGLDVFPGKGEAIKRLNYHYRILIRDYHLAYTGANSDASKNQIAHSLLQEVQKKGGGFLKNRQGDYMTEKESLIKIKKALKDYKTREKRRLARQKSVARRLKRQSLTTQASLRSIQTDISHDVSHCTTTTSVADYASAADYSYIQDESCQPPSIADAYPDTVTFSLEPLDPRQQHSFSPEHYMDPRQPSFSTEPLDPRQQHSVAEQQQEGGEQHQQQPNDDEWMEMIDLLSALE